ncbi:NADH dehydrogenase [Reticulibacter mediterranei]|uniref:NADH dehydrogenase n=1 Tax=Reticulibacter mediterranei TaxID=2778369 RepID=A0A8J3N8Q9_9CHLR|nr:NADH-quinone oxidoreductase subunit NuoF [Reticulibacter mediterranei]GHO99953.1 NADH dehydrogenase [Reticulibacter mediterranei]
MIQALTPDDLPRVAEEENEAARAFEHTIRVCVAAGCLSQHSDQVKQGLEHQIQERGWKHCRVKGVGCMGLCSAGPLVSVRSSEKNEKETLYQAVTPDDAPTIIESLSSGTPPATLICPTNRPFFTQQTKIVLANSGEIDPERLEDSLAVGGYQQLAHVLSDLTPAQVIDQITLSGLRGRGGAGYPTGLKWGTVAKASGSRKFVICNADEGDPGAFMDRSVLESDPHRVLEGMAIAAYAVGANEGYIYVRAEYPLAIKRLQTAIRQATRVQLLGNSILGTSFNFNIHIRLGAGAFVCGEETALIASIEGKRGQPRPRPPFPAMSGLWNAPTLINNVETYANIAPILEHGPEWFAGIGTERSKGTKVFALAGKIVNTGLIEVPMGTNLRTIIQEIGGGIPDGHGFKAAQTGGPSGGCIPAEHLDTPVDYESLTALGSIMGSGGMIVMDESACMVDVARYFMEFCMSESCGKCAPCRVGTAEMYELLSRIVQGRANLEDMELLQDLCETVKYTSLCGLGQAAPNPVLSTMKYFKDEYLAHITDHRCPAGQCQFEAVAQEV